MTPLAWRKSLGLSQAAVADKVGVSGKNPARTWQRWETGKLEPPVRIIVAVEALSDGEVTASSWLNVRRGFKSTSLSVVAAAP